MDTEKKLNEIECALYKESRICNYRQDIVVCNLSWAMLNHEADFVAVTKNGYMTEVEIKRSWSDFLADFKKDVKQHKDEHVYRFFYCVPLSIYPKVKEYLHDNPIELKAVITYDENLHFEFHHDYEGAPCEIEMINGRERCHSSRYIMWGRRKLFLEEMLHIARVGCMRIWSRKLKDVPNENELKFN